MGGNLHRADEVVKPFAERGVVLHGIQIEVGQVELLEGGAGRDDVQLQPVLGDTRSHTPGLGIAHLGDGWLIGNAGEPHGVGADLLGASEAFVKRQPQLGQKHP